MFFTDIDSEILAIINLQFKAVYGYLPLFFCNGFRIIHNTHNTNIILVCGKSRKPSKGLDFFKIFTKKVSTNDIKALEWHYLGFCNGFRIILNTHNINTLYKINSSLVVEKRKTSIGLQFFLRFIPKKSLQKMFTFQSRSNYWNLSDNTDLSKTYCVTF